MWTEEDERRIQEQVATITDEEHKLIGDYTDTINQKGVVAAGEILDKLPEPPRELIQQLLRTVRILNLATGGARPKTK